MSRRCKRSFCGWLRRHSVAVCLAVVSPHAIRAPTTQELRRVEPRARSAPRCGSLLYLSASFTRRSVSAALNRRRGRFATSGVDRARRCHNDVVLEMGSSNKANGRRRRFWFRAGGWAALALVLALAGAIIDAWPALGTKPRDARLERIQKSPQFRGGKFGDTIPRIDPDVLAVSLRWFKGVDHSQPLEPLPVLLRQSADFAALAGSGLRIQRRHRDVRGLRTDW